MECQSKHPLSLASSLLRPADLQTCTADASFTSGAASSDFPYRRPPRAAGQLDGTIFPDSSFETVLPRDTSTLMISDTGTHGSGVPCHLHGRLRTGFVCCNAKSVGQHCTSVLYASPSLCPSIWLMSNHRQDVQLNNSSKDGLLRISSSNFWMLGSVLRAYCRRLGVPAPASRILSTASHSPTRHRHKPTWT